ncbi:MAG: hypothetical protein RLN92_08230 [Alloalcanivorax xenomutans]
MRRSKRIVAATLIAAFLMIGAAGTGYANEPTCHVSSAAPYCSYKGKVKRVYVNETGLILVYFDTPMPSGAPSSVGIGGVSNHAAGAVSYQDKPEFANFLYSTVLAAQTTERDVQIQMRGTIGGYLKIDRIWTE